MIKTNPDDQAVLRYVETELERMDQILWEMAEGNVMIGPDVVGYPRQETE